MKSNSSLKFKLDSQDGRARATTFTLPGWDGKLKTVETPLFMPVGTQGSVKALTTDEVKKTGAQIILGNTYHLYLRPGHERLAKWGGLQKWMNWQGALLSDSGGFQVFSLSGINQIDDEGVTFQSHLDGSRHRFTAELSMQIQKGIGSDIVMAFDQCPALPSTEEQMKTAMKRTIDWARRGLAVELLPHQMRFGIVQGGVSVDLRREHLAEIAALDFDGLALGGLSVGEKPEAMHALLHEFAHELPQDRPRYLMGVGRPEDLIEAVEAGMDLFDCVMPTRNARNGQVFTSLGKINIKNSENQNSEDSLDPDCTCETCIFYPKSYLRHLYISREALSARLLSLHNVHFYLNLTRQMRAAIQEKNFTIWKKAFLDRYHSKDF